MTTRRIEVVALSARGVKDTNEDDQCRRQVELAVVSHVDPEGEEFGIKRSQWHPRPEKSDLLRFGRAGFRGQFPLEGPKAPEMTGTRRFLDSAELRVRLMVSGVSASNSSMAWANAWLPSGLSEGIGREFDKATSQVEAETRIPLCDLLAGSPDSHQSGWVSLRKSLMSADACDFRQPQLWMQVFILPEHQTILPMLNDAYKEEGNKLPDFRASLCKCVPDVDVVEGPDGVKSPTNKSPKSSFHTPNTGSWPEVAPPPLMAVVPPGTLPGQFFEVHGPPTTHKMKCPPGLKPGDSWPAVAPSGQTIQIQIPPGVVEGQIFQVQVPTVLQVQCPADAAAGSTIEVKESKQPPPSAGTVMQVQCPPNLKPGDAMRVQFPDTGQSVMVCVPAGVQPGQPFAVKAPEAPQVLPVAQAQALPSLPPLPTTATTPAMVQSAKPNTEGYAPTPDSKAARPAAVPSVHAPTVDLLSFDDPTPTDVGLDIQVAPSQVAATTSSSQVAATTSGLSLPADLFTSKAADEGNSSLAICDGSGTSTSAALPSAIAPASRTRADSNQDKFAALITFDGEGEKSPGLAVDAVPDASQPPESFQAFQDSLLTSFSDSFKDPSERKPST